VRVAWLFAFAACNGAQAITADAPGAVDAPSRDGYLPIDATVAVDSLLLQPTSVSLTWPLGQAVSVLAHYTDDAELDVTPYASLSSNTPTVATAATGAVTPTGPGSATITASYMGVTATLSVTVDVPTLAVASSTGIDMFDATAAGSATPKRSIRGGATTLTNACAITTLGGNLLVADAGTQTIDVWATGDSGNLAPEQTIALGFTPVSIATDGTSIYVGAVDGVHVFTGSGTPTATITGSATTITSGAGVAVYAGELYVAETAGAYAVFPKAASGNVAPSRVVGGTTTGLASPTGIAAGLGLVYVTDALAAGSVQMFIPAASGDAAPFSFFDGTLTSPTSVALDQTMLLVGTPSTQQVQTFLLTALTDAGQYSPLYSLEGVSPNAIALF
jgi:hypothetical protein